MTTRIDAGDAKNRLLELLCEVRTGGRFTITNRGEAVADLVPSSSAGSLDATAAIDRFRTFLREHPLKPGRRVKLKKLIAKGRD